MAEREPTRVLLVIPTDELRELFDELLSSAGCVCPASASARAALRDVAAFKPDVVIVDPHHTDSETLLAELRRNAVSHIGILVVGDTVPPGADAHVKRGPRTEELLEAVRRTLDRARAATTTPDMVAWVVITTHPETFTSEFSITIGGTVRHTQNLVNDVDGRHAFASAMEWIQNRNLELGGWQHRMLESTATGEPALVAPTVRATSPLCGATKGWRHCIREAGHDGEHEAVDLQTGASNRWSS